MFLPHQLNLDKRARFKFDGVIKHCESVGPGDKREINIDTSTSPDRFTKAIFRNIEPQCHRLCSFNGGDIELK